MNPIRIEEVVLMKMLVAYDEQGDILSADFPSDLAEAFRQRSLSGNKGV
jgi:hypothetical protein